MKYRKDNKSDNDLSILGFGCMRFPSGLGGINKTKTEELIMDAYKAGINYYDTAYMYGASESVLGEIVEKNGIRSDIYIATKLPHMTCNTKDDFDKYFDTQKKRLRTDYIDYYLIHNISSFAQWENLCDMGIREWISEKKAAGEINRIGFSYHGSQGDFLRMLDAYDWDFVQIQYNYINENYQAGRTGLKKAAEKNLPVIIMEPLLGGRLVTGLPKRIPSVMETARAGSTPAEWAFNWLWNQPEVTVVLSGMNDESQLNENLILADKAEPGIFSGKDEAVMDEIVHIFNESYKVPCTGCNYCMPCPVGINIPACFTAYNTSYATGRMPAVVMYINATGLVDENPKLASSCIRCGKCEGKCPQHIEIRNELRNVKRRLEMPGMKTIAKIARKIMT